MEMDPDLFFAAVCDSAVLFADTRDERGGDEMKDSDKKHFIIGGLLCVSTVGIFMAFGKKLPEAVPVHWDSSGNVNGTIAKSYLTFGAPLAYLLLHALAFLKFQSHEKQAWRYYLVPIAAIAISFLIIFLALRSI